jgi:hypothetical protein
VKNNSLSIISALYFDEAINLNSLTLERAKLSESSNAVFGYVAPKIRALQQ